MYQIRKTLFISIVAFGLSLSLSVSAETGKELSELSGVKGGLVVVLDDEQLTADMRVNDSYLVQGLFKDEKRKNTAREKLQSKGLYGPVTVKSWKADALPYIDNLVNLIVDERGEWQATGEEISRVLVPHGVYITKKPLDTPHARLAAQAPAPGGWRTYKKAWPAEIDEWTHWLHAPDNNAVSGDTYQEIPRGLQWIQPPRWWKSHELAPPFSAMVTARGRLFYIGDESLPGIANLPDRWFLIARDAFNGTLLWKKPIKEWGGQYWSEKYIERGGARLQDPAQVMRRLVAVGDKVFVTLGLFAPVSMLDAATGAVVRTFNGTEGAFEILAQGNRLYLAVNSKLREAESGPEITLMAVDTDSGKILWKSAGHKGIWQTGKLSPQYVDAHITLGKEGLFFIDQQSIVALNLDDGEEEWSAPRLDAKGVSTNRGVVYGRVVITYHDSILFHSAIRRGKGVSLQALDAGSGRSLWSHEAGTIACNTPPDVLVNRGLVWALNTAEWTYDGLDPRTGEKKKSLDASLVSSGTHHNCYRNRATRDFFLYGRVKGIEYFDINRNESKRVNWLKGACRYGNMPANGMIYFPSHFCTCYATSKLNGILAIGHTGITEAKPSDSEQVTRGPAYSSLKPDTRNAKPDSDWPTYRQNIARTGFQPVALPDELKPKWSATVEGNLTPPIVADQKVFVASKDDHRVVCLDAAKGKIEWTFLPEGKVDSPPSYHRGRLVFGARDGSVYCLDAASGELAWRFRAAPQDRQMGAFEQLESVWPLFGTLLVHDDKVYCAAGRNTNVNMGFFLYQLDINTGRPLIAVHHAADLSTQGEVDATVNADILVGDGSILHMRGMVFDMKTLKMIDLGKRFVQRARISPPHKMEIDLVMALGGFQDESFFNGALWHYRSKTANIISLDRENMYGVNIYARNSFKSHTHVNFHPGKESIKLFSVSRKSLTDRSPKGKQGKKKGSGLHAESGAMPAWTSTIPIRATSLLVGSDKLFLAGVRDKIDASDPWAHFDGRMGGMITVHSKEDGRLVSQIELESPAVFDGLASAGGKLFVSCKDGAVLCFE